MSIITNAQRRDKPNIYTENHHIIHKSLGGPNDKTNIVVLTAKEHFICHLLLTKMVDGDYKKKMVYAAYLLSHISNKNQSRYVPSGRMYQILKEKIASANRQSVGPNTGKRMSAEQKQKNIRCS